MALQIKGKFIESTAIDGNKLRLKTGQAIKLEKLDNTVIDLIEFDEATGRVKVNEAAVSLKSELDSEITARAAADTAISASIQTLVGQEANARVQGDATTLASANTYTDGKITALVNSAPAVLDTLKELADALGSDPNFATTVATNISTVSSAVTAETTRATAAEQSLQNQITQISGGAGGLSLSSLNTRLGVIEGADTVTGSVLNAIKVANEHADAAVAAEATARTNADNALVTRLNTLEGNASVSGSVAYAVAAEATIRSSADAALDARLDTIEAQLHRKMKFVLSAQDKTNGYVDLGHVAMANSIVASVGRLMIHEGIGEDFTVSVVGGVTRMTFVGNLVSPSEEELSVGDVLYVKYMNA